MVPVVQHASIVVAIPHCRGVRSEPMARPGWRVCTSRWHGVVALCLLLQVYGAWSACAPSTFNFYPEGTTNVPEVWTRAGQAARGNADLGAVVEADVNDNVVPKLHVAMVDPYLDKCQDPACWEPAAKKGHRRSLLGASTQQTTSQQQQHMSVLGAWWQQHWQQNQQQQEQQQWRGASRRLAADAPCIKMLAPGSVKLQWKMGTGNWTDVVDDTITFDMKELPLGKNCLTVQGIVEAKSAVTNDRPARSGPSVDRKASESVCFRKVATGTLEAPATPTPGAPPNAAPDSNSSAAALGPDPALANLAKYYCIKQYNIGNTLLSNTTAEPGDAGITACSANCTRSLDKCVAFGVTGGRCYQMKAVNTSKSTPDTAMEALCFKARADWLALGQTAGLAVEPASNDLYCLAGYDIRGDQAQGGDIETPVAVQSEVVTASARECVGACRTTTGCQYFVQKAAACYLKQNLIGGKFGITGAAPDVSVTCVRGTDSWLQLGSILEISGVVPAPLDFTNTLGGGLNGVLNPGVAPGTYSCLPELSLNGTLMKSVSLTGDDAGRLGCAANCDATPGCVAHTLSALGACNLLSAIQINTTNADNRTYSLCLKNAADYQALGKPDADGFYCLPRYDMAGNGVGAPISFAGVVNGTGPSIAFCNRQCLANADCQFAITNRPDNKCYLKNQLNTGPFGKTGASPTTVAACVKGRENWAVLAAQVSMPTAPAASNTSAARSNATARARNAAGQATAPVSSVLAAAASSLLGAWLLLALV